MVTARESIASEVESLALHAGAVGLIRAHDLLRYIAGAIEGGHEGEILDVIREATASALIAREAAAEAAAEAYQRLHDAAADAVEAREAEAEASDEAYRRMQDAADIAMLADLALEPACAWCGAAVPAGVSVCGHCLAKEPYAR